MEPQYQRSSNGGGRGSSQHYYYYEDDDDFSAEEIFNLFFGYSGKLSFIIILNKYFFLGPTTRTYRRRQQPSPFHFTTHSTHNQTQNVCYLNIFFLIILIFFIF
jgi:hypothetical protein